MSSQSALNIYFNGFRSGNSIITSLLQLFSKLFGCNCVRSDLYNSKILCESVYAPSILNYGFNWQHTFFYSSNSRFNEFRNNYDVTLSQEIENKITSTDTSQNEILELINDIQTQLSTNKSNSNNTKTKTNKLCEKSVFDHIDAIFYINLASRPDRREHFLAEIAKLTNDMSRVHLIDAVAVKTNGALGCTLSHIKTFELIEAHPEWKKCIVFEDDFTFRYQTVKENTRLLCDFFENPLFKDWDLVNLSFNPGRVAWYDTVDPNVKRVHYTQTTSGYCISREYVPILKENFLQSAENMSINGNTQFNCCDINWNKLAPISKWYLITPSVGYQYNNFSDIEQRVTTYGC